MPRELTLDLQGDVVALTEALCNVRSVSRDEQHLADLVEEALRRLDHLTVERIGNNVVARTDLGRRERVVLAGHLDTVPEAGNLPVRRDDTYLHGLGTSDMKSGDAVFLRIAATVTEPNRDLTFLFYDCEEIEASANGLRRLAEERPDLLRADVALLGESSNAGIEAGCQGSLRVEVTTHGERAHAARAWKGSNAIHAAAGVLARLESYEPRRPLIDGLTYHEGLNAVGITGGVATNVLPDACTVTVNHRFAPDRSEEQALAHVREVFDGYDVRLTDSSPGALPGLSVPATAAFVEVVGGPVAPKFGWTDVARFSALGVPAVNYGPGDPSLAHKREEKVLIEHIRTCEDTLRAWLRGGSA